MQRRIALGELQRPGRRRGLARPAQQLQRNKNDQRPGQLADEGADSVEDAFLPPPGSQLIPFDHIGEHRIRQRIRSRDADPGQRYA